MFLQAKIYSTMLYLYIRKPYEWESGFTSDLVYTPKQTDHNDNNEENKKWRRKIIWFNPPYSKSVKSNIGKTFLHLIKRFFPKTNKLHEIFNRNTAKVSYSCMSNVSSVLSSPNLNVINPYKTKTYGCNCRIKESCPLQSQCLTPKIVYQVDVKNDVNSETKLYSD